jgi:hypothetical protein
MSDDVRATCRRERGPGPCIRTYAADMVTVTGTHECVGWCPVLKRRLEDADELYGGDGVGSNHPPNTSRRVFLVDVTPVPAAKENRDADQ